MAYLLNETGKQLVALTSGVSRRAATLAAFHLRRTIRLGLTMMPWRPN
jgi:hypothetical protein